MKIKLIDFGAEESRLPYRPHGNDAGADVYMPYGCILKPGDVEKVPLGFGIEVPDGYAGYVFPRSSMAAKGQDPYHPGRGEGRAAYHHAGCDHGFCFRAWGGKGHGRIWEYRGVTK